MRASVNHVLAGLLTIGLLHTVIPCAQARAPKRIDWAKEGPSLVWEEELPAKRGKDYVFHARKGQTIYLSFIDDTGVGSMDLGKVSIKPNSDPTKIAITVSKDYLLTVRNNSGKATSFRIAINLEDHKGAVRTVTTLPKPRVVRTERIRLPKGHQVAVLKGTLGPKQSKRYVAYVLKGNMITLVPHDKLGANIRARIDGKEFDFRDSTSTEHQSKSKDHTIEIYNTSNKKSGFGFDIGFAEHG